jgi:thioredoxin-dependent peroxiredoxin
MLKHRTVALSLIAAALTAACADAAEKERAAAPKVGDVAKDFDLTDLAGEKVKLSKLAEKGPVVVVVLRGYPGYQCPLCSAQFGEFLAKKGELKRVGAQVVFVYPGPAEKLKEKAGEFVKGQTYPEHFHIVIDPDYAVTDAYGLRWDEKNETAYPSAFVVDGKRKVTYAKVSTSHGGRAKVTDILRAVAGK